jgi:hypothetical protein
LDKSYSHNSRINICTVRVFRHVVDFRGLSSKPEHSNGDRELDHCTFFLLFFYLTYFSTSPSISFEIRPCFTFMHVVLRVDLYNALGLVFPIICASLLEV